MRLCPLPLPARRTAFPVFSARSRLAAAWSLALLLACPLAGVAPAQAQGLPPEVDAALARAKIPREALSVLLVDAQGQSSPRVSHRANVAMNPASVMKLVTTYAALDLLGPNYKWSTSVYADGPVRDGTLHGNLTIQGQGDPHLVVERLWLLLRRVQGLGIRHITGDIVLDNTTWNLPPHDPAAFDGEPFKPQNVGPDALLVNFKSVAMTFAPEPGGTVARVQYDPPLAGVQLQATVPLVAGECGDYRSALRAEFSDPKQIRFGGSYAASCGETVWAIAYADPKTFATRALQGLWQDMGGKLQGTVRMGTLSSTTAAAYKPVLDVRSEPLAEIVRDINKHSNNVMAQQVFLTLGRVLTPPTAASGATDPVSAPGTFEASRKIVQRWWAERLGADDAPVLENGSGLSRNERISANALGRLLQTAYASPLMPDLMNSLPINGVDGTLRRAKTRSNGYAHLKTGSLNEVVAIAGYVHAAGGRRYVLVAIVNYPNASAARPALDAMVDWASR